MTKQHCSQHALSTCGSWQLVDSHWIDRCSRHVTKYEHSRWYRPDHACEWPPRQGDYISENGAGHQTRLGTDSEH